MAKDKKEKREERMKKKKGVLKLKPEKTLKKRRALNEAGVTLAMDESKKQDNPVVVKDSEGLKSGKSGKNALTKIKKKKLKDKKIAKLESSLGNNNGEEISASVEEKTVSPGGNASAKLKKKKLKDEKIPKLESSSGTNKEEEISANVEEKTVSPGGNASAKIKKKKLKDKMMPEAKSSSEKTVSPGDDLGNQEESNDVSKKKLKKGKKKGKDQLNKKQAAQSAPEKQECQVKPDIHSQPEKQDSKANKSEESIEMDEQNAEEISSIDEDCSRGMKKWLMEYKESRPGIDVLQQRIDDFISAHEAKLEQEKQEREAAAAEGGWTVVVHQKGRKKTTDAESGIAVGSVAPAAVLDRMSKKKSKEGTMDFYRFQRREAQRNEVMMLQEKFEQDKKRIQQLRAARKFRPY